MPLETNVLYFAKLTKNAYTPSYASKESAGFDFKSPSDCVVPAQGKALVYTDLQIRTPPGTYGRIAARSGLAINKFISIGGGVIDADYRGNVGVIIFNHSNEEFVIKRGDAIAQLICEKISLPCLCAANIEKDETERGDRGFGSTDQNK